MHKRSMFFLIILSALLIAIPVYIFLIYPNLDSTIDWTMHGVVVNSQGEVCLYNEYKVGQFTVAGTMDIDEDLTGEMKLRIVLREDFRYLYETGSRPGNHTRYISNNRKYTGEPYYTLYHFAYDRYANEPVWACIGLCPEREYMIFNWDDDKDLFLVASTDPDTDPNEILTYFKAFIESSTK